MKEVAIALDALPRTELVTARLGYPHLRSLVLGFGDDLELHAGDDAIQVRSASRLGGGDLDVNRARVETLSGCVRLVPLPAYVGRRPAL